jgi:hypothetical protein
MQEPRAESHGGSDPFTVADGMTLRATDRRQASSPASQRSWRR